MEKDNQHTVTLVRFDRPTTDAIYINPKHVSAIRPHSKLVSIISLVGASNEFSVLGRVEDVARRIAVNIIDGK